MPAGVWVCATQSMSCLAMWMAPVNHEAGDVDVIVGGVEQRVASTSTLIRLEASISS